MALVPRTRPGGRPAPGLRDSWSWALKHLRRWGVLAHREDDPAPTCLQCGRCCEAFGGHLHASSADLARWRALGRDDLLSRVEPVSSWIWIDPATRRLEERCPFLVHEGPERALCAIQDVKPDICRDYPTLAHGRRCLRGVFLR
jgi:Fe-S-cluster containining protein